MYKPSQNMTEYPGLDVKKLTDDQLQKKIGELNMRLSRSGASLSSNISSQLISILNILRFELQERYFRKTTEQDPNWKPGVVLDTESTEKEKDDLDKLIDIN